MRSIQRKLSGCKYRYKHITQNFLLSAEAKETRLKAIEEWILEVLNFKMLFLAMKSASRWMDPTIITHGSWKAQHKVELRDNLV